VPCASACSRPPSRLAGNPDRDPVAYLLSHYQFRGKEILDTLIDLPLVLPPSRRGSRLLLLYGQQGLGALLQDSGVHFTFTLTAVVMAQMFIRPPRST